MIATHSLDPGFTLELRSVRFYRPDRAGRWTQGGGVPDSGRRGRLAGGAVHMSMTSFQGKRGGAVSRRPPPRCRPATAMDPPPCAVPGYGPGHLPELRFLLVAGPSTPAQMDLGAGVNLAIKLDTVYLPNSHGGSRTRTITSTTRGPAGIRGRAKTPPATAAARPAGAPLTA